MLLKASAGNDLRDLAIARAEQAIRPIEEFFLPNCQATALVVYLMVKVDGRRMQVPSRF